MTPQRQWLRVTKAIRTEGLCSCECCPTCGTFWLLCLHVLVRPRSKCCGFQATVTGIPTRFLTHLEKRTMTAEKTSSRSRAQHQSAINFMPVEGRVYFVRDPTAVK